MTTIELTLKTEQGGKPYLVKAIMQMAEPAEQLNATALHSVFLVLKDDLDEALAKGKL